MTTIRDVAKHASVSPATVSLVLRNAKSIRPVTRRKVEAAINDLDYRRRSVGRPAGRREQYSLAIVYPGGPSDDDRDRGGQRATRRWFSAIRQELADRGHHLSFFSGSSAGEPDQLFREVVKESGIAGAIFIGTGAHSDELIWARDNQLSTVVVNRRPERDEFSSVWIDNYGGGKSAADYLVKRRHRRIGLVIWPPEQQFEVERVQGFIDGLAAHGLKPVVTCTTSQEHELRDYAQICEEVMAAQPTAVFCLGDSLAVGCVNRWQQMGVKVPEDLSVVGFDDTGERTESGLRLTSIAPDSWAVAKHVITMTMQLIKGRGHTVNLTATVRTGVAEFDTVRRLEKNHSAK